MSSPATSARSIPQRGKCRRQRPALARREAAPRSFPLASASAVPAFSFWGLGEIIDGGFPKDFAASTRLPRGRALPVAKACNDRTRDWTCDLGIAEPAGGAIPETPGTGGRQLTAAVCGPGGQVGRRRDHDRAREEI